MHQLLDEGAHNFVGKAFVTDSFYDFLPLSTLSLKFIHFLLHSPGVTSLHADQQIGPINPYLSILDLLKRHIFLFQSPVHLGQGVYFCFFRLIIHFIVASIKYI